ncbi:MAG: hypothetical protein K8I00_10295, partial [Candidatus Omnitrophica bacterium]|nr:hypothetical protein [Candidatus Omnitrophota bacterium]
YNLCRTLVEMLGRTKSHDAAVFLSDLLKSVGSMHNLTAKIITSLRDIADPVCVPLLLDWIHQNSQYAHACAECLLKIDDPTIAPALMDLFHAGERPYLAPYIGRLKVPQAAETLIQAHRELYAGGGIPDPKVSARLMEGFKNLADPRTLPYVHEGLRVHWDKYYDSAACDFNTAIYILRPALEVLRAIGDRSSLDLLLSLSTRDYAGGLVDTVTALVIKFRTELEPSVWMQLRHWRVTQVIDEDGWRWERKVDTTELQMLVRDHIYAA